MAAAVALPSLSQIESLSTSYLTEFADHFAAEADLIEVSFAQAHDRLRAVDWEGEANDAALDRSDRDVFAARTQAELRRDAATVARYGAEELDALKRRVVTIADEARAARFEVTDDMSAIAYTPAHPGVEGMRLQPLANEMSAEMRRQAAALVAADAEITRKLNTAAAQLEELRFTEAPSYGRGGGVRLVDNKTFKDAPATPDPNDPNRHPRYPDHKPNGEWAPGNSGLDGDAEAQKAFDEREQRSGIPVERKKIYVTTTDPETGETLRRQYDGLEPIPGEPGKFVGLEHKAGGANLTPHQERFDALVKSGIPTRGTLDGKPIEVVGTDVITTPRSAAFGADGGAGAGAVPRGAGAAGPSAAPRAPIPEAPHAPVEPAPAERAPGARAPIEPPARAPFPVVRGAPGISDPRTELIPGPYLVPPPHSQWGPTLLGEPPEDVFEDHVP